MREPGKRDVSQTHSLFVDDLNPIQASGVFSDPPPPSKGFCP